MVNNIKTVALYYVKNSQKAKIVHLKVNLTKIQLKVVENQKLGTEGLHKSRDRRNVPRVGDTGDDT